ncbi:DUF1801 domain-containing protein [Nocardia sp. KC 131]|uniref:DUF1801 domain-containing protein n=1 Tax=Nocardia arseniciresistens TaxID=3392119 RepID=UPI00398F5EDA
MDEKLAAYFAKILPWQNELCQKLQLLIHDTLPDVDAQLLYGKPHYLINGHYAAVIAVAKDKVSFMVFNAADIPEVKGVLRSLGKGERKAVTITEGQDVDYAQLAELLTKTTAGIR